MIIILLAVALIVGGLIGTVGVGGILLIPALSGLGGLTTHAAMATSLFSFIFTGLLGTWLYCKHGSIHWGITIPVCIGGLVGGYPGALANAIAPAWILNLILGCIIIFAGIYALFPAKGGTITYRPGDGRQRLQLLLIGATVGFGSGLTGVGGPVLSVPLMVILGFTPSPPSPPARSSRSRLPLPAPSATSPMVSSTCTWRFWSRWPSSPVSWPARSWPTASRPAS